MALKDKFFDHPVAFLLALLLFALMMSSIFGCAIRPDEIRAWTDQARAEVLRLDGKMQRAINDSRKAIASEVLGAVEKVQQEVTKANATVDAIQASAKEASDATTELAKDAGLLLFGLGGGAGGPFVYKKYKKNGSG